MKKLFILFVVVILNLSFLSCTPEDLSETEIEVKACCGDGEDIPPPPPPPSGN